MSEEVKRMFSEIAGKYDLMNNLMSFGIHHLWRKKAVKLSGAKSSDKVLDCACGTGDLSIEFKNKVGNTGQVIGTDFSENMVLLAKDKVKNKNIDINFEIADAMNLQFKDNQFDYSSISFGIRNVDDPVRCLQEMSRVVKPGGKVVVIEFGQPQGFFKLIFSLYSFTFMPVMGKLFANNQSAYEYLPATSAKFPCREEFLQLMSKAATFKSSNYYSLSQGIAFIYIGVVK
jgi:demethylmenaquinone methyltransferase/2-methoxy-6-polyprenyl-1,4-benzoquinol methylase